MPRSGQLTNNAKSKYRQDKRHYSELLNKKQKEIIEKTFEKEIKIHGYTYFEKINN